LYNTPFLVKNQFFNATIFLENFFIYISIINKLENIDDPMDKKVISERELRKIIHT